MSHAKWTPKQVNIKSPSKMQNLSPSQKTGLMGQGHGKLHGGVVKPGNASMHGGLSKMNVGSHSADTSKMSTNYKMVK